jgi:N-formylmaleamate deformylase
VAAPPRSRVVERGPTRLNALCFGSGGPALLVLPGITSPAAVWDFVAEPLARDHMVCVLDLRGRGRSSTPHDARYTLAEYSADAAAVIEALELERPTVVGHSLGARILAALASDRPDLVGAATLVDPPLCGPGRPPYPTPLEFYLDAIAAARAWGGDVERIRRDHPGWSERQLRARAKWLPSCDERAVTKTYRHFHDEDFMALWDMLAAPTLIVGSRSAVVPPDGVAELRARNPRARVIAVEGAGHMVPWDQPERFLVALRDAIAGPPR